jgi:hypothetical protein
LILVSGTISVRLSLRSLHAVLTAGRREELHLVRTRAAGLQFAIFAFKEIPMRSRVTHRAYPLNQSRFRFEEVEGVVTMARECHFSMASEASWEVSTELKLDGKLLTS